MQLTLTPVDQVLRTGKAEHSESARRIIDRLEREYNIHISACYVQSDTKLLIPPGASLKKLIRSGRYEFIKETILTFYIHSARSVIPSSDSEFKNLLHDVFFETLRENGLSLSYERVYPPEEMNYYGWNRTPKSEWSTDSIIPLKPAAKSVEVTNIEFIDRLALWNYMSDALNKANACEIIKRIGAKVFVSFNKGIPVYLIVIPNDRRTSVSPELAKEFSAHMTSVLKRMDVWDAVTPDSMTPVINTWDMLSPEQRFSISKN